MRERNNPFGTGMNGPLINLIVSASIRLLAVTPIALGFGIVFPISVR